MDSLTFLGTGGGRFAVLSQKRYTGGLWLELDGVKLAVDPGPGALVRALQFSKDPSKLDAVLVSHNHLDHYNDAEVMLEAMSNGLKNDRGLLIAPEGVLEDVSGYHQKAVTVLTLRPGVEFTVKDLTVTALPTFEHANGIGFRFHTKAGDVVYTGDTGYSKEVAKSYNGSRILVLNVIFPDQVDAEIHLNTVKASKIIGDVKPELAVIQHFGLKMICSNPDKQAEWIQKETGVETIAARDGMIINLNTLDIVEDEGENNQTTLERF